MECPVGPHTYLSEIVLPEQNNVNTFYGIYLLNSKRR